ncbi:MAG: hypothetical protein ABIF08_00625 [Nanoarchaeota archaeon]
MPVYVTDFVTVVIIPFVVEFLKRVSLPKKYAPYVAILLATIYVAVSKWLGWGGADFSSALDFIMKALGIGGISVLGYDIVKTIKE